MTTKFEGTFEEFKAIVEKTGIKGEWQEGGGKFTFRSKQGGILNWWESSGTIQYQGNQEGKALLEKRVEEVINEGFFGAEFFAKWKWSKQSKQAKNLYSSWA